jgi:hypothetical protein
MNRLFPSDVAGFARKYRFAGGKLRRVKLVYRGPEPLTVELTLSVRPAARDLGADARPVRLKLRLVGVDEFRFQKRPTVAGGRVTEARFGYFGDLYFVNLDAWRLQPGEVPKIHDFRASDTYLAGRELYWEEVGDKPA